MIALITGGSGSGKSEYAESLAAMLHGGADAPLYYIATMRSYGSEDERRIARHRAMRAGRGFETVERATDIGGAELAPGSTALIECMSNLMANEMFGGEADRIVPGLERLMAACRHLVIVTNEVFSDGIRYPEETENYIRALGDINIYLAGRAEYVCEVVYGIPLPIKGEVGQ